MTVASITPRHRKALEALRYECDYEDGQKGGTDNFILRSSFPAGIGDKTLADLLKWEFAVTGPNRWHPKTGYRITDTGRAALAIPAERPIRIAPRLKEFEPRLKTMPDRLAKPKR